MGEKQEGQLLPTPCHSPFACSCAALMLAFAGLFEWEVPLTRFVRSFYPEVGSHLWHKRHHVRGTLPNTRGRRAE